MTALELEEYFKTANLPETVTLSAGVKIVDIHTFIGSHLEVIRTYPNAAVFSAFYERLIQLKQIVEDRPVTS